MNIRSSRNGSTNTERKLHSLQFASEMLDYLETHHPKEVYIKNSMERQISCNSIIRVYSNVRTDSWFCGKNTCEICNHIKGYKNGRKYFDDLKDDKFFYGLTLTSRSVNAENLKRRIDKMMNFNKNSSFFRKKRYRELNPKIKSIRVLEIVTDKVSETYHPHFHFLLTGMNEEEIKEYGNLIIDSWIKYFSTNANIGCQKLEPLRGDPHQWFYYLFKGDRLESLEIAYNVIKATYGRHRIIGKNIKTNKAEIQRQKEKFLVEINNGRLKGIYVFQKESGEWLDIVTGEILHSRNNNN